MNWPPYLFSISACGPIVESMKEARLSDSLQRCDSPAVVLHFLDRLEDSEKTIAPSVIAAAGATTALAMALYNTASSFRAPSSPPSQATSLPVATMQAVLVTAAVGAVATLLSACWVVRAHASRGAKLNSEFARRFGECFVDDQIPRELISKYGLLSHSQRKQQKARLEKAEREAAKAQ